MRGASLSDLHLGFRAFPATIDGRSAREVDVERAWERAVQGIIEADRERGPIDLVTVAGDVVHHPRVGTHALKAWRDGVRRLVEETEAWVIVVQGNHDAGRTSDVLTPIILPDDLPRVHIVTAPKRIRLYLAPDGQAVWVSPDEAKEVVSVACFPFVVRGDGASYRLDPDPEADINVLLMHAAVRGSADGDRLPYFYGGDQALDVGREADRWDVIAVGDYHEFTALHPERLAFYSGSLERTSSNIWDEHQPKGWVWWDTATREMQLVEVPTRPISDYDLGDFDHPPGVGAEAVNDCLGRLLGYDFLEDGIVRFKVDAFPREEREHVEWSLVRELKRRCLHFYLDIRYGAREIADLGDRRERTAVSLAEEAVAFFADDEAPLRDCALGFLGVEADREELDAPGDEEQPGEEELELALGGAS